MDIPMNPDSYNGPKTPFFGPSLEWHFSNMVITPDEAEQKARISISNPPVILGATFDHLRRILTQEYPRTEANIQRKILAVGLPINEAAIERNPRIVESQELAFQSIKSVSRTRDYRMKREAIYKIDLGDVEDDRESTSIYAKNNDHVSRIRNMAKDVRVTMGNMTILCLAAGLAQSVDPLWVPVPIREAMIEEVKFFHKWLAESNKLA
jgi:hypothetical protein